MSTRGGWGQARRGQAVFEYAVLIAIVVAALVSMHTYVRRAMQASLKNLELELNATTQQP